MDVTSFSASELIDKAYELKERFFALHDSDDFSDDCLDEMAEIVENLEALQAEADKRVTLAVRREELANRIAGL